MTKTNKSQPTRTANPTLTDKRQNIFLKLTERIAIGNELLIKSTSSTLDLEKKHQDKQRWENYNIVYLKHCFSNDRIARDYIFSDYTGFTISSNKSNYQLIKEFNDSVNLKINELQSICDQLEIYEEPTDVISSIQKTSPSNNVFIVHGHDETLKLKVSEYLQKLELNPILLSQANAGKTVIEKFESHAQEANFAVVLLTADDMGYSKSVGASNAKPRARQNVIFELGYFVAKLGRKHVCALYEENVEILSDFYGVLYASTQDDWKHILMRELKAANFKIDANKLYA